MNKVEIVDFTPEYAKNFEQLNFEWLEKYFYIEDYDRKVLGNPQKYIMEPGGYIFMALINGEIVGTVALIYREEGVYELSKMAVTDKFQGNRIGQKLMYHCICFAGKNHFKRLFLDSNRKLTPAITLYHKVGFKEIPTPEDSPYDRSDIRMELNI
jgi:GNAT superfamily N-acetyltransferase